MLRLLPRLTDDTPGALLEAGLPAQLARVLWARGVRTAQEADAFLSPRVEDLHDPMLLHDMPKAVARMRQAMDAGERIVVYGDYDVDGVSATALLVEALRAQGASARWYIPSRHREGYGLNQDAVRALAREADLLITVDCGITSVQEAELASSLGLDLIITDHHEPPAEQLPRAVALVDPLLGDYPFRRLCGAGVALKLAWALFGQEAIGGLWELAALATVADLVPLLGENRIIVHQGLTRMQDTRRTGLRALLRASGLEGKAITAGHLGFQLGPRINAGGRLEDASSNVELLITPDEGRASQLADALNRLNADRQRMEMEIVRRADQWVQENVDFLTDRVIIVQGDGWNHGVVGLAAGRLTEKYAWPTVVLTQADDPAQLTGSARSVPGINIHRALTMCADLFIKFGGHAQAAGMTLAAENLPALRHRLGEAVAAIAEPDAFVPSASYDLDITLPEVDIPLIEQLDRLAPTGFGNPSPVFLLRDAQVLEARGVGADGKHLKLRLMQDGAALDGIAFGQGEARATLPQRVDALFSPSINEYMGRRSAQCEVSRLLPHAPWDAFAAECAAREDDFDLYWLRPGMADVAPMEEAVLMPLVREALEGSCQGTLLAVRTLEGARRWTDWLRREGLAAKADYAFGAPRDSRRFNTLCALPDANAARGYARVFDLDGALAGRAIRAWLPSDDALRGLYRTLRAGQDRFQTEGALAQASGLRAAAVRLGLTAFAELELAEYRQVPFLVRLLPPRKCDLAQSETLRAMRATWMREDEQ